MVRDPAQPVVWRDYLGIALTIVSALLLAVVLWQMTQLGGGLDRVALQREQLAVAETPALLNGYRDLNAYRNALALNTRGVAGARERAARTLRDIGRDFRSGPAAVLGVQELWETVESAWAKTERLTPNPLVVDQFSPMITAYSQFIQGLEDASGISVDPNLTAQGLANAYMAETSYGISVNDKMRTMIDLTAAHDQMTLQQRLTIANTLNSLRSGFDLTGDSLPLVAKELDTLLPDRKGRWDNLPARSGAMLASASSFADAVAKTVLLAPAPTRPLAEYHRLSADLERATLAMNAEAGYALEASLAKRGEIQEQHNRDFYLSWVLGGVLLVGIMMIIAQIVARRDRMLLREAQQESARLSAELARQEAEEALRLSEAQFRAVFDGAAIGIAVIDRSGVLVDSNEVFRTMFGDTIEVAMAGHEQDLNDLLTGERETFEFEAQHRSPMGQEVWADATVSIVNDENDAPRFAICMFRDKTALKHSERRMLHDKTHDSLTGLPNRQLFEEHLRRRFEEAGALLDSFFAVLFVDLEHFKDVNESMGHAAGDLVLTQIAGRLRSSIDARDVVARLGSDEFAVLVQSLGDILHVESLARRILNNLSKAVSVGSRSVYLGASVGVAIGSATYERAEDVMRDAEIAMQHAKSVGGTRYALFDSKMHQRAQKRIELTNDLRLAIERNQFRMLYQPILRVQDGRPVGCEALIRWDHPTEGVVNPGEFIGLAEQTGLAAPIGRFVLETAAAQLAAWRRNRGAAMDFDMHVNISASELIDPEFERFLVQVVEHHGLSPSSLTIEITESLVLDAGTRVNTILERLRDRGFKLCIDDFGTGYSSLRYLQQFKVDAIKIDRSFVAGSDGELASEPIVRTLMTLAEAYNVRVVAEGVETVRQRDMLRNAGCRLAQGYLYAHPITAAEMVELYPDVLGRISRSASA
jgi:diguanylate cyclase (GGDEF)-like protein/PAS domain S-box-containing protein